MTTPRKDPIFSIGEPVGELTVVKHLAHSNVCPEGPHAGKHYSKRQWWYRLTCGCGNTVVANQDAVRDTRRRCDDCNSMKRSIDQQQRMREKYPKPKPTVSDFATMRLK